MSTLKSDYEAHKIPQGCPPEHVDITGVDNTLGLTMDLHLIPEKEQGWGGVANSDSRVLADRIVQLERKLGEAGSDTNQTVYTLIPKLPTNPAYSNTHGSTTIAASEGGSNVNKSVGAVRYTAAGNTYAETIVTLDRTLQLLSARLGRESTPLTPPTTLDNFVGAFQNGTTVLGIPRPFYYPQKATIAEAIAKMDSKIKDNLVEHDRLLGIGLTELYVSLSGSGDFTGSSAGNAIPAAVAFGETGQINRTSSGLKFILAVDTYTAFDLISNRGHTVVLELLGGATFNTIEAKNNSAIIVTGAHNLNSAGSIRADSGSYISTESNLTAVSLIYVLHRSTMHCSGTLTSTSGSIQADSGGFVEAHGNLIAQFDIIADKDSAIHSFVAITANTGYIMSLNSSYISCNQGIAAATDILSYNGSVIHCSGGMTASTGKIEAENSAYIGITGDITSGNGVIALYKSQIRSTGSMTCNGTATAYFSSIISSGGALTCLNFSLTQGSSLDCEGTLTSTAVQNVGNGIAFNSTLTVAGDLIINGTYSGPQQSILIQQCSHMQVEGNVTVAATAGDGIECIQTSALEINSGTHTFGTRLRAALTSSIIITDSTVNMTADLQAANGSSITCTNTNVTAANVDLSNSLLYIEGTGNLTASGYVGVNLGSHLSCNILTVGTTFAISEASSARVTRFIVGGTMTCNFGSTFRQDGGAVSSVGGVLSCQVVSGIFTPDATTITLGGLTLHERSTWHGQVTNLICPDISVDSSHLQFSVGSSIANVDLQVTNSSSCLIPTITGSSDIYIGHNSSFKGDVVNIAGVVTAQFSGDIYISPIGGLTATRIIAHNGSQITSDSPIIVTTTVEAVNNTCILASVPGSSIGGITTALRGGIVDIKSYAYPNGKTEELSKFAYVGTH